MKVPKLKDLIEEETQNIRETCQDCGYPLKEHQYSTTYVDELTRTGYKRVRTRICPTSSLYIKSKYPK